MSLVLLQGPISTVRDPDDAQMTGTAGFQLADGVLWFDDFGLVGFADTGTSGAPLNSSIVCNLDGVCYLRQDGGGAFGAYDLHYDTLTNQILGWRSGLGAGLRQIDPLTLSIQTPVINAMTVDVAGIRGTTGWFTVATDAPANQIWRADLDATTDGEFSHDYTFVPAAGVGGGDHLLEGPDGSIYWFFADASGTLARYDYLNKTEVFPNTTNTNRLTLGRDAARCFYSPKFDIFISVEANAGDANITDIYIWANELLPDSITAPVALTPVTAGRVSTIQITLLDDNSVGIPDRLIDWTITVGDGELSATQSTTDSNGVAEIDYRAETSGGSDPTIQAELTF
jgi:hypothetical protein